MHMIGHLNGDSQIMAVKSAKEENLGLCIELPEHQRAIVFVVTQEDNLILALTDGHGHVIQLFGGDIQLTTDGLRLDMFELDVPDEELAQVISLFSKE